MKSFLKNQILAILVILALLSLSHLSAAHMIVHETNNKYSTLQQPTISITKLIPVPFIMQQSFDLSPELPKEGRSDLKAICPNGFVPARWSILGFFGSTEWRDVGKWETIEVLKPLQAMGSVEFRIWFSYTGSGSPEGQFNFFWRRNEENIAEANVRVQFNSEMDPRMVTVQAPLINQTPFQAGDKFSILIQCRNNFDGAHILYGSREHSSSVVMICNAIEIVKVDGCKEHISGIYDDVFSVRPNSMQFIGRVNGIIVGSLPTIDSTEYNGKHYRSVTWEKKLSPGTHEIEISISYWGSENVSMTKIIKIKKPVEPNIFGIPLWIFYIIVGLLTLAIIAYVAVKIYNYRQEKLWLESRGLSKQK